MKKVILISGKARHGKDTLAESIESKLFKPGQHRNYIIGFADYLKFVCEKYYYWDGKKDEIGRTFLQKVGDCMRASNKDVFVNVVKEFIKSHEHGYFIIKDVRYLNEIESIKRDFDAVTVRIERNNFDNGLGDAANHKSEIELDDYGFDFVGKLDSGTENVTEFASQIVRSL